MDEFLNNIQENRKIKTESEVRMMAPLVLAYVGDAIFEVFIRNYLVKEMNASVHQYHKRATRYVRAKSQAEVVHALETELTEAEWTIVKRGRNQKSATVPKNANLADYRYATGFEALLGYLFYIGEYSRLSLLMNRAVEIINNGMDV
ncbi:Mini-ribonuclease 3 [Alkaliphilus sp. MSJ-5]|uniref:Mini-ribonuclease 3 n=1 Tax=Alkaliphilus flagellatus TaxID=2841507 RepID=A0ABS6G9T0_9FIRM|nr:ribonuclease III domain-containing protein [Alkaliphilus flagellatus]MBU5678150.1 Mini-ribonuclease 3 [Alkaliphilus flagellatus]